MIVNAEIVVVMMPGAASGVTSVAPKVRANPVDWYPCGSDAFARARREDKPAFLSIGCSTCRWCHVMEKESFEDPAVAKPMHEAFVSIKVDREERPDPDDHCLAVSQALAGGGG